AAARGADRRIVGNRGQADGERLRAFHQLIVGGGDRQAHRVATLSPHAERLGVGGVVGVGGQRDAADRRLQRGGARAAGVQGQRGRQRAGGAAFGRGGGAREGHGGGVVVGDVDRARTGLGHQRIRGRVRQRRRE